MKTIACSALVLCASVYLSPPTAAQTPVGAFLGPQPAGAAAQQQPPAASAEVELVFWQSIADSTNPAEFEAYLRRFPNGMFSDLAQIRLEALRAGSNAGPVSVGRPAVGVGSPASGSRVSGAGAEGAAPRRAGEVFRDCPECPEMVVSGGRPSGDGPLRGDGGRVSCVRVGDGRHGR